MVVLAADQLTKWWAVAALGPDRTIDLVWTLRFRLLYNRGTAFSLTSDSGPVVTVVAVAVVVALVWSGRNQRSRGVIASYGLIIGGTVGNLIDRGFRTEPGDGFLRGGVVDFIDLQWFPVFNLADASLTIGIGLLILTGFVLDGHYAGGGDEDDAENGSAPPSDLDVDDDPDSDPDADADADAESDVEVDDGRTSP